MSLLFYKPQQEHLVKQVEGRAGITFQRVGAPQPVDIIKAGAKDSIRWVWSDNIYCCCHGNKLQWSYW